MTRVHVRVVTGNTSCATARTVLKSLFVHQRSRVMGVALRRPSNWLLAMHPRWRTHPGPVLSLGRVSATAQASSRASCEPTTHWRACDAGAAAVAVSNHGGRHLARALATADALAEIVAAWPGAARSKR